MSNQSNASDHTTFESDNDRKLYVFKTLEMTLFREDGTIPGTNVSYF